ncbi:MAG: PPOX class F420-dependent oxidoreductase [Acidimicrobiia bacterium]
MDPAEARDIVRTQHNAVLATRRHDGRPQLSPVNVGLDPEGRVTISSRERAYKVRNIRRDPRVSVCVLPPNFFGGRWIQIDGTADVLSLPDALEPLVEYYRGISGEHPDWDDYRAAMVRDERVLVRVTIERAGPDRAA